MHFYGPTDVHVFMKTSNRIADSKREDLLVRETRKAIWQEFWWISENFFQFIFRFVNFFSPSRFRPLRLDGNFVMQRTIKIPHKSRNSSYLAEGNAGVESIHEVVDINHELGIKRVEPLGQILPHCIQIFLARFERPIRTRFQQNRCHCSSVRWWIKMKFQPMLSQSKSWRFLLLRLRLLVSLISLIVREFQCNVNGTINHNVFTATRLVRRLSNASTWCAGERSVVCGGKESSDYCVIHVKQFRQRLSRMETVLRIIYDRITEEWN